MSSVCNAVGSDWFVSDRRTYSVGISRLNGPVLVLLLKWIIFALSEYYMIMTLAEILARRRSVRKFTDRKVERGVIDVLVKAAMSAPSSKNTRSTRLMIVDKPQMLEDISQMRDFGSSFLKDAPLAVVVLGDTALTDLWVDNCAISATILQLSAEEQGLGSCWVHVNGRPRKKDEPDKGTASDYLRLILPIPESWSPLCVIALGYAADYPAPHPARDDSDKVLFL